MKKSMNRILIITNRTLCKDTAHFLAQIRRILTAEPAGILLREKDLPPADYLDLAGRVKALTDGTGVPLILHSHPEAAYALGIRALHMPLPLLRQMKEPDRSFFSVLGASTHSLAEMQTAEALGCTYVTAGHIYATDCKKGLPPRGVSFLRELCAASDLPVYALGGITPERMPEILAAGAAGAAVMSSAMLTGDPAGLIGELKTPGA